MFVHSTLMFSSAWAQTNESNDAEFRTEKRYDWDKKNEKKKEIKLNILTIKTEIKKSMQKQSIMQIIFFTSINLVNTQVPWWSNWSIYWKTFKRNLTLYRDSYTAIAQINLKQTQHYINSGGSVNTSNKKLFWSEDCILDDIVPITTRS